MTLYNQTVVLTLPNFFLGARHVSFVAESKEGTCSDGVALQMSPLMPSRKKEKKEKISLGG
jgi:hypothetical protein